MDTGQGKSTGARSTFQLVPIGVVKSDRVVVQKKFMLGIKGLERYEKIILLYWAPPLELCVAKVKSIKNNEIYVEELGIDGKPLIDIKPYMREVDW